MSVGYIYCYTNILNNKKYIGQTSREPKVRAGKDGKNYLAQPKFGKAILKYGWSNFRLNILETLETDNPIELSSSLNEREAYWIAFYSSISEGYNIDAGGKSAPKTEEHKRKIGESGKGKHHWKPSLEQRLARSKRMKKNYQEGKSNLHISEESRQKMSLAAKARIEKYGVWNKGKKGYHTKPASEERKKLVSLKLKGRKKQRN